MRDECGRLLQFLLAALEFGVYIALGYTHLVLLSSEAGVSAVLGDSGGVVNSLDVCPASLKSLGCFYFRCVLSSHWKAVTVNLRILRCQL